jgi:uncharacterized protein (TIGR03084 family)
MQQAQDFFDESNALRNLLSGLDDAGFGRSTAFKGWTFNQILRHLHFWNYAANLSLTDADAFRPWIGKVLAGAGQVSLTEFEHDYLDGTSGQSLLDLWAEFYPRLLSNFSSCDPAQRVAWAGPGMSARSSITARLMETWAHGQAIYDELGIERRNADRIKNIVVLGINTYGWTFRNRELEPPEPMPHVALTAPSGEIWTFGEHSDQDVISGSATEFCQVVTQCRNIADTNLAVTGENAMAWMRVAQCFAGPPNDPPAPGTRRRRTS